MCLRVFWPLKLALRAFPGLQRPRKSRACLSAASLAGQDLVGMTATQIRELLPSRANPRHPFHFDPVEGGLVAGFCWYWIFMLGEDVSSLKAGERAYQTVVNNLCSEDSVSGSYSATSIVSVSSYSTASMVATGFKKGYGAKNGLRE